MFRRRSDLPLAGDATSRFLPWLVALMVFMAAMAVAAAFVINGVIDRWDRDVSGTLTVQVLPAGGEQAEAATDERVRLAVDVMRKVPGVQAVKAFDKRRTLALLEPWLGSTDVVQDLPLPRLIDVTIDSNIKLDLADVADRLSGAVPGASLDDHRVWLSRLVNLSRTIQWLAVVVVALIGAVTSATVVYGTRTGMAVPALTAIGWAARRVEGGFLPSLSLPILGYVAIGLLPLLAAGLAMLTARLTVHGTLSRMP